MILLIFYFIIENIKESQNWLENYVFLNYLIFTLKIKNE